MVGRTVAHYRVVEKLGEGGMGVVYKARDTHLDRFAALKILPPEKVTDAERKRRFVQEAKAASALNHPNIITVYDVSETDGITFIAMEYVEGQTLDRLIGRKGLGLNDTLRYSIQIAGAMAKAHAAGIVHRDLKPSNVMVTADGLVKVLDFGLAKLTEFHGDQQESTQTLAHTEEGTLVGTLAYMSPEQAEGKPADSRSDIFSFGAVLYEMVTGRRAFAGGSAGSTLAAVIKDQPPAPSESAPDTPRDLEKIILRCLRKDPARRYQGMADLEVALAELKEESDSGALSHAAPRSRRRRPALAWGLWALVITLAFAAGVWYRFFRRPPPAAPARVGAFAARAGLQWGPAFSPDGKQIAFVWNGEKQDNDDIYVQLVDEANPRRLTTDPAFDFSPVWSPDALRIAFLRETRAGTEVVVVPAAGGAERRLHVSAARCRFQMPTLARQFCGLAWSPNGKFLTIVDKESPQAPNSIFLLDIETHEKRKLTTPPADWYGDGLSVFSPDGRSLAFVRTWHVYPSDIYVLSLSDAGEPRGEPRRITPETKTIFGLDWTSDGRSVVFASDRGGMHALWRVAATGGEPERLTVASENSVWPAVSRQGGRLAYVQTFLDINVWRVEAPGAAGPGTATALRITQAPMLDVNPAYSSDGKGIAFASNFSGSFQPWTCAADGSQPARLTERVGLAPRWSPDGRWIAFMGGEEGNVPHVEIIGSEGGSPRRLTTGDFAETHPSWSRDGQWIYFASNRGGGSAIWKAPAGGGTPILVARNAGPPAFESFDAKFVYHGGPGAQIWKTPVSGGEPAPVLKIGRRALWTLSASGIYALDPDAGGGPAIEFFPFASGGRSQIRRLGGEPDSYVWGMSVMAISPDERWVLYEHRDRNEGQIMLVDNFR